MYACVTCVYMIKYFKIIKNGKLVAKPNCSWRKYKVSPDSETNLFSKLHGIHSEHSYHIIT